MSTTALACGMCGFTRFCTTKLECTTRMTGKPVYNFTYVDQIYDGLLDRGVRPFVEISFMP